MLRIRTVKPALASHEGLFEAEQETGLPIRIAWVMLFCVCDREGRFVWRPRTLKTYVLPFDNLDFSRVLDALGTRGFLVKYRVGDEWYGCIPTFTKHQSINHRESASDLPALEESDEVFQWVTDASATGESRVSHASSTRESRGPGGREGKGRERKTREDALVVLETVEGLNLEAWAAWVAYRKGIDKPIRPASIAAAAKKLAAYGPKQMAAVEHSIANGWQGLFDPPAVVATNGAKPPCPPMYLAGNEYNPAHREWMERYA